MLLGSPKSMYYLLKKKKLGTNPSEMEVRTFASLKEVIWDQLQASKAEIIQK